LTKYFIPTKNLIFTTLTGSRLYGTNNKESDYDYVSVCIPPIKQYLSNFGFNQTQNITPTLDNTIYDFRKAIKLIMDNNPNMIELLYIPGDKIKLCTKYWQKVIDNRDLFLSKKAKFSFSGYAFAQLKRLKNHKKWLDNPPVKPTRKQFNLPDHKNIKKEHEKAMLALPNNYISENLKELIQNERLYRDAMKKWSDYKQWIENRNPKRIKLEKKIGYDAKHAMHLYRLMLMATEILDLGRIIVDRTQNGTDKILKEIRNCEWSYDKLIFNVEKLENQIEELYHVSELQHKPQINKIDELMIEIIEEYDKDNYDNK
jgi:hypothetical protein